MSERPRTRGVGGRRHGPCPGQDVRWPRPGPPAWFPPGLGKAAELITIQIMDALTLS